MTHRRWCTVEDEHDSADCRHFEDEPPPMPLRTGDGVPIIAYYPTGRPSQVVSEDIVLCYLGESNPDEPFVTWVIRGIDGWTFEGHYYSDIEDALEDFRFRCERGY